MADPSSTSNSRIPIISPLPHPPGHGGKGSNNNNNDPNSAATAPGAAGKPIRRVSFSEFPTRHYESPSNRSISRGDGGGGGGGGGDRCCAVSCCCSWCMWSCIILLCLVFIVTLAGALFFGYFQPKLPVFRIERLNFPILNITTTSLQNYVSTDIELFIVVSNVNRKIEFSYSPLTVYVSSGFVSLGKAEVPGFNQLGVNNMTLLKVHTGVSHSMVDNEDGEGLRTNFGSKAMNVDVVLSGAVKFIFGGGGGVGSSSSSSTTGLATTKLPITVSCKNVNVSRVALGNEPQCKVELFSFQQQQVSNEQTNVF